MLIFKTSTFDQEVSFNFNWILAEQKEYYSKIEPKMLYMLPSKLDV